MQLESEEILTGYSSKEKAAYLGVLASLATADRNADEEEVEHFREMATAAGIPQNESEVILEAANDTTGMGGGLGSIIAGMARGRNNGGIGGMLGNLLR